MADADAVGSDEGDVDAQGVQGFDRLFADRLGRTTLTMLAMATSGVCALLIGLLFGASPVWLILLCLVWGVSVVADSAQFSASVAELSAREDAAR